MVILLDSWPVSGDSEYAPAFAAYRNYVTGVSRLVEIEFGTDVDWLSGLVTVARDLRVVRTMDRRSRDEVLLEVEASLQRSRGLLRALRVADLDPFIPEFNATIPTNAY